MAFSVKRSGLQHFENLLLVHFKIRANP